MSARSLQPEDLSFVMREYLGYWQALRKLGYSADYIYLSLDSKQKKAFCYIYQDKKGLGFEVGTWEEMTDIVTEYRQVCATLAKWTEMQLARLWETSKACFESGAIVEKLMRAGMYPPKANPGGFLHQINRSRWRSRSGPFRR